MNWSKGEKKVARAAFDRAYEREMAALIQTVQQKGAAVDSPEALWELEKFLRQTRREIDEKYDYRYSMLILVFARLINEGWLTLDDLAGLREDKLEKLRLMHSWASS